MSYTYQFLLGRLMYLALVGRIISIVDLTRAPKLGKFSVMLPFHTASTSTSCPFGTVGQKIGFYFANERQRLGGSFLVAIVTK